MSETSSNKWTNRFRELAKDKSISGKEKTNAFRALGLKLKAARERKEKYQRQGEISRNEAERKLRQVFGFNNFYDEQWIAIQKVFKGERVLLIEKTGFGKSLCFQFPALYFDGITIVFTPLIALMRDQVRKLNEWGISAECINSGKEYEENNSILNKAKQNKIKILYIAPERMENIDWQNTSKELNISMIVVDEAHCISTWGHDFRPAYMRIIRLVNLLPKTFPVLATTATATKQVEEDIKEQIGNRITSQRGELLRSNFHLFVIKVNSEDEKYVWLAQSLEKIDGTGIIYTGTKADTEMYSNWLKKNNIDSVFYNSSLDNESREDIEQGLIENRWKCVVSTNALGMGIDKPDIKFIVHTQAPQSPIHYYQEIGRAGRDGKKTFIILFYNPNEDDDLPLAFIEGAKPSISKYKKVIKVLKEERLGLYQITEAANLKQNEVRVILADLIEQKIINEAYEGRTRKYEYRYDAPELNEEKFNKLKQHKLSEYDKMKEYIEFSGCRMNYLCNYLGDNYLDNCKKCDNDMDHIVKVDMNEDWEKKIREFFDNNFPILPAYKDFSIDGVASSYYGVSDVGKLIHKCKYQNGGNFPDILLKKVVSSFKNTFPDIIFDFLVYIPPTESGDLVRNFARKLSNKLNVPLSHNLIKTSTTKPQKIFQNWSLKRKNVENVFDYQVPNEIEGKNVLIFDDIYDSGATIKEISKLLKGYGANIIAPIVIAKTVGGDI